jgi:hypothetical protein
MVHLGRPGGCLDLDFMVLDEVADGVGGHVLAGAVAEVDLHLVRRPAILQVDLVAAQTDGLEGERVGQQCPG